MKTFWDCSLCRIENKGQAFRCSTCSGKLKGKDRLLHEISQDRRVRGRAAVLSALAAGSGQIYGRRWMTGLVLASLIPLAIGLLVVGWGGFSYGHLFLAGAAVFVLVFAAADAYLGVRELRAPCQQACPAGIPIPDYLQLTVDGEYEQAYSLIRTRIPLVGVIGRVCPHPCEVACYRGVDGEPISINGCKRFLADAHRDRRRESGGSARVLDVEGGRPSVGVVGSGPAGLACAYYLSQLGVPVTVYEAGSSLGGRLASTIPDYRLPPFILTEEIEDLRDEGVTFAVDTRIGPGGVPLGGILEEHVGVFVCVGAPVSVSVDVPGSDLITDFQQVLWAAKDNRLDTLGRRVAVIGGGNAAIDVCRTALRLGAEEVHLLYRRTRDEMPARDDEVEEAIREGVQFHYLAAPAAVERSSAVAALSVTVQRMALGEPDASGRRRPMALSGDTWLLQVDNVIPALGQRVDSELFADPALAGLRRNPDGTVWADPRGQKSSLERVYVGGDAVSGAATAVQAMAQGRRAALRMYADLSLGPLPTMRYTDRRLRHPFRGHRETPQAKIREEMPKLTLRSRCSGFREVDEGLREASACRESGRCLQCHREL